MSKKLIYVLNQYSPSEASHFFHVLHLLEVMAEQEGVEIALIIEKASVAPPVNSARIQVILQQRTGAFGRFFELMSLVRHFVSRGYQQVFVRISTFGALAAVAGTMLTPAKVNYWNSGTTIEHDRRQPLTFGKLKWYARSRIPFLLTKNLVDYFVTGPESMAKYYIDVAKVQPSKIRILYNDIDITRFEPVLPDKRVEMRARWGVSATDTLILFVHRLSPVKKTLFYLPHVLDPLFASPAMGDHVRVLIVGGGSDERELSAALAGREYASRVRMLGRIANREIHELYQIADIFMNPTHEEGFPRVLLEAMSCGLPVVTTDAGGIPDILGDRQQAYMVSKDDRDAFGRRLIELVRQPTEQALLKSENLEQVKRYSTETVARMYVDTLFS